jgi:hypothetical protein
MTLLTLRLPSPYEAQRPFVYWNEDNPQAQVLVAPCAVKVGKSLGSAIWLVKEMLVNDGSYGVWIAPTYLKAKIGYRYCKALLPDHESIKCLDGLLEIRFGNRSYLKFLHGKDAETTVEGEAVDRFVIDESGKITKQVWYSLFTTITQTMGLGIITGTPRGFTWYYDQYRKAKAGDPFYVYTSIMTEQSPFVNPKAIAQAKRLLPKALFDQYYRAMFVSLSSVFGDIGSMFDDAIKVEPGAKFWVHPDEAARTLETVTGWDVAKQRDYSVFYTVNLHGQLVGYARFTRVPYEAQVDRLKNYLHRYMKGERYLRYDATGVGGAVGEMLVDKDIDATITPVIFSQRSKQEMVSRTSVAIEAGWHRVPRIEQIEHEFGSYELTVTRSGLFSYSAPDGEHDDVVSAALLAISGAHSLSQTDGAEDLANRYLSGELPEEDDADIMTEAASEFASDPFFDDGDDEDGSEQDDEFDYLED